MARQTAEDKKTLERLAKDLEANAAKLDEARTGESAKREMLAELHAKAERVARAEREAARARATARAMRDALPPTAATVRPPREWEEEPSSTGAADLGGLADVSASIARELDESVRRVRRAIVGADGDER